MKYFISALVVAAHCSTAALAQVSLGGDTTSFGRTIHVHATGSAVENAASLTRALGSAAISSRSDPATQPVVIQVGPGVLDFGGSSFTMPDHVSLRGAGMDVTTITGLTILAAATDNRFSDFTIVVDDVSFDIGGGANVEIDHVKSQADTGVYAVDPGTIARISNSSLVSTFDDAVAVLDGAAVTIQHSTVDGTDDSNDGVIWGSGTAVLNISYSFIGLKGITDPWPGTANCAYISTGPPLSEVSGCPAAPLPPSGGVQQRSLKRLSR